MKKIKSLIKTIVVTTLIGLIVLMPTHPSIVRADDVVTQTPIASTAPSPPAPPSPPSAPIPPAAPSAPTAPAAPTPPPAPTNAPTNNLPATTAPSVQPNLITATSSSGTPASANSGNNLLGQTGGTTINTGGAAVSSAIVNTGNTNTSLRPGNISGGILEGVNTQANGANSVNNSSSAVSSLSNSNQINNANTINSLNQSAVTGNNNTSFSVGNSSISSGNANSSGTVISALNTNVDGVAVAQFNVVDDHVGDIILDFNQGCVSGCNGIPIVINNSGNGASSANNNAVNSSNSNSSNQTNNAQIGSSLTLSANSGNNNASFNTGGDSNITTGNANVTGSALTFANNNIAGNVVYSVVNIYGNLVGDIIMTPDAMNAFCGNCWNNGSTHVSGNGAQSSNSSNAGSTNNTSTAQFNTADISNNLILDPNTGGNSSSFNTDGNSTVQTGNSNVKANVVNVANNNISGGNFWLVLVNDAGKWIGHIMGAPDGSTVSGSPGLDFTVDNSGNVIMNNGAGSSGTNSVNQSSSNNTTQTNNAKISNTLNLSANTGHNKTMDNTGGSSNIKTGDANIIANIVNFVNNNIVGGGKLFVTVVNVFGSWLGNFVGPGQHKETPTSQPTAALNQTTVQSPPAAVVQQVGEQVQQITQVPNYLVKRVNHFTRTLIAGEKVAKDNNSNDSTGSVLAYKTDTQITNPLNQNKKVTINLAWGLFAIPLFFIIIKRKAIRATLHL